ncbi:MAG: Electron-transferring-flavoprotein dehydrogenase, partial [uncultured bacterium]
PNIDIFAKQIVLAEGCHGSVTQKMIAHFNLQKNASPQTYGLGIKEIWEIPPEYHKKGSVTHTVGYPLDNATYGGSFIYHFGENLLSIGFVVGLDYQNPYLNPYETFQCFKSHRAIYPLLATGRRIAYGARALSEGGLQSIPKLTFPGGIIIGDAAGLLNVPKMKGIHHAMKSGIVAGDSLFELLKNSVNTATPHALTTNQSKECTAYPVALKKTWLWRELYLARNIRPGMRWGLLSGLLYAALDTYLFRGRAPWTLKHAYPDNSTLQKADQCQPISYPKHDQCVTFDLATSLHLAHIQSDEDEPCHLKLKDEKTAIEINLKQYASPETRYCPAGVYEIIYDQSNIPKLVIHASNCIHCKACDIKDPTQNITWTPPEGGSGPQYEIM